MSAGVLDSWMDLIHSRDSSNYVLAAEIMMGVGDRSIHDAFWKFMMRTVIDELRASIWAPHEFAKTVVLIKNPAREVMFRADIVALDVKLLEEMMHIHCVTFSMPWMEGSCDILWGDLDFPLFKLDLEEDYEKHCDEMWEKGLVYNFLKQGL